MKNKYFFIFISFFLLSFSSNIYAESCSSQGYSIFTINGIFTDEVGAVYNRNMLKNKLPLTFNSEPIYVDYLYNPTHLSGAGDIFDVIQQGLLNEDSDYDLVEMLYDASEKVKTEKVLLVAHSQGNFYSNNFYNKVVNKSGGIPSSSLGVYGVATPASYVAGGGKYITSDTDKVISNLVGKVLSQNIMTPNTHIDLSGEQGSNGHDFSKIYLKYRGNKIISDIKSSLLELDTDNTRKEDGPCIAPPKIDLFHEINGEIIAISDLAVSSTVKAISLAQKTGVLIGNGIKNTAVSLVKTISSLASKNKASSLSALDEEKENILLDTDLDFSLEEQIETPLEENIKEVDKNKKIEKEISKLDNHIENKEEPIIILTKEEPKPIIRRTSHSSSSNDDNLEINPIIPVETEESDITEEDPVVPTASSEPDIPPIIEEDPVVPTASPEPETPIVEEYDFAFSDLNGNTILDSEEDEIVIDTNIFLVDGTYRFKNLIIKNNSTLEVGGNQDSLDDFKGTRIVVDNLTIEEGSFISADKNGYFARQGPGVPSSEYMGSNYGGFSDREDFNSPYYGSALEPMDLGSGGGYLGDKTYYGGGGAIRIIVNDNFINNGTVSASGSSSASGGSVYITTDEISGNGIIKADGGSLFGSGYFISPGGGGRVAVYYNNSSFTGTVQALGGCGSYDGWSRSCSPDGTAGMFDVVNKDFYVNNSWVFQLEDGPFSFNNIYFSNKAKIRSENDVVINANEINLDNMSDFLSSDGQEINASLINLNEGSTLTLSGDEDINVDEININSRSTITVLQENVLFLEIPVITISSDSSISANEKGYFKGPGYSGLEYSGASYGGIGYRSSEDFLYGSSDEPVDFGSSGEGYHPRGGGAIRLIVDDYLLNDGIISSNGSNTASGGSVYITVNDISGAGYITANGGSSYCPNYCFGPGGGGRIAIYYQNSSFNNENVKALGVNMYGGISEKGTVKIVDESIVTPPVIAPTIIKSFKLNNFSGDLASSLEEPISISIEANEGVDWVSINVENSDNPNIHKIFHSIADVCVDGQTICERIWNGELSEKGTVLIDGTYRIKAKIEDMFDNVLFEDYLPFEIILNRG